MPNIINWITSVFSQTEKYYYLDFFYMQILRMCLNNPIIEYLGTFIVLLKFWLHKKSISLNCFGEKGVWRLLCFGRI